MYWETVPGFFDFQDIYDEAVATAKDYDVLVEVGTLFGKSAFYMAERIKQSGKKLIFVVVDKWEEWEDAIFHPEGDFRKIIDEAGSLYLAFLNYVYASGLGEYIDILREDSTQAAKILDGTKVHFVFIDADHSYDNCYRDIQAWLQVTRPGGIIAGHDYNARQFGDWPGVRAAVAASFNGAVEVRNSSWLVRL